MDLKLIFRRKARLDIDKAYGWYEGHRKDLGELFLLQLDRGLQVILDHPKGFPRIHKEFRQCPIDRFPYVIIYRQLGKQIVIMRVFHTSQHPGKRFV